MSVSESERHQVFQWFEEAMGPERAAVVMQMLPSVGWADLATRDDLRSLAVELRSEMAELRGEVHLALAQQTRMIVLSVLASNATMLGLVMAAAQLR